MVLSKPFSVCIGVVVACAAIGTARPAFALKEFFDEFKVMYVKPDSADAADKSLAAAVETEKCNVCHVGKSKKERNSYGEALAGFLDKKEDKKNVEKIKESLLKVADMPSDGKSGPTFGALLKEGKLPGGPVAK